MPAVPLLHPTSLTDRPLYKSPNSNLDRLRDLSHIPSFFQYQFSSFADPALDKVRQDFVKQIKEFTEAMDSTGSFFLGTEVSFIDLIIAHWAVRLWVFDHFKGGLGKIEGKTGERWTKWLLAVESRESVRYADDTAQSELAKATREGKGVP